eukprot:CAMPEP_0202886740 /NCGR_PEP_ID=MMETSP1391-20130828/42328_1 /ASSEMBLY_ACC=CAM_ASM_000867 /TAXON_ID=1034604 /ORGANISM="Chlamydomonas leiostraca, Strain SAG 11-49" /LENGTH=483 /DNA_ID=CAMNT_0049570015 /DNA_START=113 /DNA_END=1564 /DNA_ORIENTATION=+
MIAISFYSVLFVSLVAMAIVVEFLPNKSDNTAGMQQGNQQAFKAFRNNYLFVYSMAMAGDWLQGPYIYALYEHYGYKVGDIGRLFIAGFGSSMVFGTLVGALADKYGRKKASLLYMVTYSMSCMTKHSGDYWTLMFGRLLGGVSTSLLFSAFESWLVAEHFSRGYAEALLGDVFSKAVFLGAGLMAILSGLVGNVLVEDMGLGPVAPFDAAIAVMTIGGCVIWLSWPENYGDSSGHSLANQFKAAAVAIMSDQKVALLGAMQSLFEAAMYTFVFLWTPALSPDGERIPHGIVFACFMTACMVGSAVTGVLMRRCKAQHFMVSVFLVSALSMAVPFVFHLEHRSQDAGPSLGDADAPGITTEGKIQLLAFCVFEGCVGIFWPSMMALRAHYVPEEMRSTIINIFRIPLNLFVCVILYKVSHFPLSVMFGLCVVFLFICLGCQLKLNALIRAVKVIKPHADNTPRGGKERSSTGGNGKGPAKARS